MNVLPQPRIPRFLLCPSWPVGLPVYILPQNVKDAPNTDHLYINLLCDLSYWTHKINFTLLQAEEAKYFPKAMRNPCGLKSAHFTLSTQRCRSQCWVVCANDSVVSLTDVYIAMLCTLMWPHWSLTFKALTVKSSTSALSVQWRLSPPQVHTPTPTRSILASR